MLIQDHRLCNEQRQAQPHGTLLWVPGAGCNLCNCTEQPCDRRGDQLWMQWLGGSFRSSWFCQTSPCQAQSREASREKRQPTPSRDSKPVQREMFLFLIPLTAPKVFLPFCVSPSVLSSLSVRISLGVHPTPDPAKFAATTTEDLTKPLVQSAGLNPACDWPGTPLP